LTLPTLIIWDRLFILNLLKSLIYLALQNFELPDVWFLSIANLTIMPAYGSATNVTFPQSPSGSVHQQLNRWCFNYGFKPFLADLKKTLCVGNTAFKITSRANIVSFYYNGLASASAFVKNGVTPQGSEKQTDMIVRFKNLKRVILF
jgi:hypothetical protein